MNFSAKCYTNYLILPSFILLIACAPESYNLSYNFDDFSNGKKNKVVRIFLIKDTLFSMKCDVSGNKLIMKFSKKEKKWKRSKYTSKDC